MNKLFSRTLGWVVLVFSAWAIVPTSACGQSKDQPVIPHLDALPGDLALAEGQPQSYIMVADYYTKDLFGRFFTKTRVQGQYTRGQEGGFVSWQDVTLAESYQEAGDFPAGQQQDYMENFRYIPADHMLLAESFAGFPPNSVFVQNLVWDAMGFETFAWEFFDSLQLNIPYRARSVEMKMDLAGQGTFENKTAYVTWAGLSQMNGELCALIQFQVMDNPLEMDNPQMTIKGRSHYWGNVWVSLLDKQIEHATLSEDVVLEMKMADQEQGRYLNTTREIVLRKITGEDRDH